MDPMTMEIDPDDVTRIVEFLAKNNRMHAAKIVNVLYGGYRRWKDDTAHQNADCPLLGFTGRTD